MTRYLLLCCALLTTSLTGCGDSGPEFQYGTLSGTAKVGDEPFGADAVLMFLDAGTGQAYTAPVSDDGSFEVDGNVRVGTYTVYLAPKPPSANDAEQPMAVQIDDSVPDKYWNESTSDIQVTVGEGDNARKTVVFEKS